MQVPIDPIHSLKWWQHSILTNKEITYDPSGWKLPDNYIGENDVRITEAPILYYDTITTKNKDHSNISNDFGNNELMSKSCRYISFTIPNLKTLEGKIIKPYLYIIDNKNVNYNLKIKSDYDLIFIEGKI